MPALSVASAVAGRLGRRPGSAAELMQALNVSQTTVSRALRELERQQQVLRIGATRGARYALRRAVAAIGSQWPIYRIDEQGTPLELGVLCAIERSGYFVTGGPERIQGIFQTVPYYLQDARPAGFLGRAVPAAYPELGLPPRVTDWTDEHFLSYLAQRAPDSSGVLAEVYWERLAEDPRISTEFQQLCATSLNRLRAMPRRATAASSA